MTRGAEVGVFDFLASTIVCLLIFVIGSRMIPKG